MIELLKQIATNIYSTLGPGFSESIYHRAFEYELRANNIQYESEKIIPIHYKNIQVGYGRADIVLPNLCIIEFKSISTLRNIDLNQLKNYITHSHDSFQYAIAINFPTQTNKNIEFITLENPGDAEKIPP